MNTLALDFERRAKEHAKSADDLYQSADFGVSPQKQALFVVGKLTSNLLYLMSEQMQFSKASGKTSEADARRQKIMERNNAIRDAAAADDWVEFDRLTESLGSGDSPGGDGEP